MTRASWAALPLGTVAACLILGALAPSQASAAQSSKSPRLETVTLVIRHRVFPDFVDVQKVKLNQEFPVGDSDFTGRVVQYVPDFAMDTKTGKVISRTQEPKNPAFKIIVKQNKTPQDTTWAMINMIPHFGKKSMLAFRVSRIDFIGHEPIIRADSTAHPPMSVPAPGSTPTGTAKPGTKPPLTPTPSHTPDKQTGKASQ